MTCPGSYEQEMGCELPLLWLQMQEFLSSQLGPFSKQGEGRGGGGEGQAMNELLQGPGLVTSQHLQGQCEG